MTLYRWLRKMPCSGRKFVRVTKFLLAGVAVFCVSWIACVQEWHGGVEWRARREASALPTMRTIVGYSEGKRAELDRPSPFNCIRLPAFPFVPHINRTWSPGVVPKSSWQHVPGTKVSLYAAYYDERLPQRYIRILASFEGRLLTSKEPLYCQTRQENPFDNSVEVVAAKHLEIWNPQWDLESLTVETPLLLSCPLTEPLSFPSIVSVVTEPCDDPTNAFSIQPSQHKQFKRNFTICVKDMNFNKDISQNIIEWIEINKLLGVEMIDMYIDNIRKESENVLLHYRNKGNIRLFHVPINDKPKRSLWQRRRDHIITYNDCLYRNIGESEYVIPLDVDEVILPKIAHTLFELIQRLKSINNWSSSEGSAITVQNVFFFDFMQGPHKYKHKKVPRNKSKMYVKRDDVRILNTNASYIGEIELVDSGSFSNEVIEYSDDRKFYEEYKVRCGKELVEPKLARHVVSSALISPVGYYGKSMMVTRNVLTAFNHYPLASLRESLWSYGWAAPFFEVQLNHYKESCDTTVVKEDCARYGRRARLDRSALRLRRQLTRALASAVCTPINIT
ncbi:uncharacterized protein LOC126372006 [Pectinophora gossypiella]|uniref:uncharacterized protein LOC126372006 n=1 Tax=Pectinophora gossypiella TaxID=13191 RepID=UPI00214E368A|nr:uncharacterized protein LOC126372006 [Pectinophora gossypiella]